MFYVIIRIMIYSLCHKNIPVLRFKLVEDEIREIISIENINHIPVGLFYNYSTDISDRQQFSNWWKSRSIPASRQNLNNALEMLGNTSTAHLVTKSFGLSLSDHYWAKPDTCELTWEEVNFFQNDFSEDVGKALFGKLDSSKKDLCLISPDNTSDGWLKKKWIIKDGERVLIKGGSGLEQQEPFNEVLASEICKRLNLPHVEYSIIKDDNDFYSVCEDFVSINTEVVSAEKIYKSEQFSGGEWDKYEHFKNSCLATGIRDYKSFEKSICSMIVVDYIMANIDRHFGNFGFLRNPDSLEWIGPAPIFDTGSSLFYKTPTNLLSDEASVSSSSILARPFGYKQSDQIELLPCKKLCRNLSFERLNDISEWFENLLQQNERMSMERRSLLCNLLKERVRETERIINSMN